MKIIFLPWPNGPDYYTFDGEVVTATHNGVTDSYDLSDMPESAILKSADRINGADSILFATRIDGELHLSLCQQTGPGHWLRSSEFDTSEYDTDTVYVELNIERPYSGRAWAKTRQGKQYMEVGE